MDDSTDPSTGEDLTASAPGILNPYTAAPYAEVNPRVRFIPDNDPFAKGKVVAINRKHYPSFDSLKENLCKGIGMRVERITTPLGRTKIQDLNQFKANGLYVCRTGRRGGSIKAGKSKAPWHAGKLDSAKHRFMLAASDGKHPNRQIGRVGSDPGYYNRRRTNRAPKKINFIRNGNSDIRRTILFNRQTAQDFVEFRRDVAECFEFESDECNCVQIFTEKGKEVCYAILRFFISFLSKTPLFMNVCSYVYRN